MAAVITLSPKQAHEADRDAGLELIIPWPDGLTQPTGLDLDEEADATPAEYRTAQLSLDGRTWDGHDLRRVLVAMLRRPEGLERGGEVLPHLCLWIRHRRWHHSTSRARPAAKWAVPKRGAP